jgi:hypothetical protein
MKTGHGIVMFLLLVTVTPASLNADPCYGCENYQGQQYCNPFEEEFRFEQCEIPPGATCQLSQQCPPVMTYLDFNVHDRVGPGGNYLPSNSNNVLENGRLINSCTGFAVAEHEFDSVPTAIEI